MPQCLAMEFYRADFALGTGAGWWGIAGTPGGLGEISQLPDVRPVNQNLLRSPIIGGDAGDGSGDCKPTI